MDIGYWRQRTAQHSFEPSRMKAILLPARFFCSIFVFHSTESTFFFSFICLLRKLHVKQYVSDDAHLPTHVWPTSCCSTFAYWIWNMEYWIVNTNHMNNSSKVQRRYNDCDRKTDWMWSEVRMSWRRIYLSRLLFIKSLTSIQLNINESIHQSDCLDKKWCDVTSNRECCNCNSIHNIQTPFTTHAFTTSMN